MNRSFRTLMMGLSLGAILCLGGAPARAQSAAEKTLLEKAQSQEQSGHLDLAAQTWQQILLSDPNNQDALAGLARWAKLSGNDAEAETYIERLRAVNPNSPEIAKIEGAGQQQDAESAAAAGRGTGEERAQRRSAEDLPPDASGRIRRTTGRWPTTTPRPRSLDDATTPSMGCAG